MNHDLKPGDDWTTPSKPPKLTPEDALDRAAERALPLLPDGWGKEGRDPVPDHFLYTDRTHYYTDPTGKQWRILEGGVPRRAKKGECIINSFGNVRQCHAQTTYIYTIVEPCEPRKLSSAMSLDEFKELVLTDATDPLDLVWLIHQRMDGKEWDSATAMAIGDIFFRNGIDVAEPRWD